MSFDPESRDKALKPLYPLISEKAVDFLGCATRPYHPHLFKILKDTYIPVLLQRLATSTDTALLIEDYQQVCY